MLTIIHPLALDPKLSLMTLYSLEYCLRGQAFNLCLLSLEGSNPLLEYSNQAGETSRLSLPGLKFGEALNVGAESPVAQAGDILFFLAPGMVLSKLPLEDLDDIFQNPYNILGYQLAKLTNPFSNETQSYLSWLSLMVSVRGFREIGGFSDRLPIIGGDFLYALETSKRGGNLRYLQNQHFYFEPPVTPETEDLKKVHHEVFLKQLPFLVLSRGLKCDALAGWKGLL